MQLAIAEAQQGLAEGGLPIGSVLVHQGKVLGQGHNRRIQQGSTILHGEMDALENSCFYLSRVSLVYHLIPLCYVFWDHPSVWYS
jgi:tRNA(Arg) A34 adenosine deaminase TadA